MIHETLKCPPVYMTISRQCGLPGEEQQIILIDEAPFLVSPSIHSLLLAERDPCYSVLLWIDSFCMYSYRTVIKDLGNLRSMAQFSEGFDLSRIRKTHTLAFKMKL